MEKELFDIDVFKEDNKYDGSDKDQEPNEDDCSSEDEAQVAITAGIATYYDNPFPRRLLKRHILTQQPRIGRLHMT